MIDIEAIKVRAAAATPGPWGPEEHSYAFTVQDKTGRSIADVLPAPSEDWYVNRDFIAHAREDIPALVSEVERLRCIVQARDIEIQLLKRECDRIEKELAELRDSLCPDCSTECHCS